MCDVCVVGVCMWYMCTCGVCGVCVLCSMCVCMWGGVVEAGSARL